MMIRRDFNFNRGLGWARIVHLWTLERMIAADVGGGDIQLTVIALALRALRRVVLIKSRANQPEGRAAGLSDGHSGPWAIAC